MKNFILGLIVGLAIGISWSASAYFSVAVSPLQQLTPEQEIALGHTFSMYNGQKLEIKGTPAPVLPATELRFRALEARVSALEAKKK